MQEIARAGWDGMGAHATLYVNKINLASRNVSSTMKDYVRMCLDL